MDWMISLVSSQGIDRRQAKQWTVTVADSRDCSRRRQRHSVRYTPARFESVESFLAAA